MHFAYASLAFVNMKAKPVTQKTRSLAHKALKPLPIGTDHIEIVNISAIMSAFEHKLHILVKHVHVYVAEQLAGKVPNRKSATFGTIEKALVVGQSAPFRSASLNAATHISVSLISSSP